MKKRNIPTIGMDRHSGTEKPGSSLFTLYSKMEQIINRHFSVEKIPDNFEELSAKDQAQATKQFFKNSDLLFTEYIERFRYRRAKKLKLPIFYLSLGLFPRGHKRFGPTLKYFMSGDVISFSSRPDLAIYKNLVDECQARESYLPFFVDTDLFVPYTRARRDQLRRQFQIKPDEVVFLYVGRVTSEKNVQSILSVFSQALKKFKKARLLIVGRIADVRFKEFGVGPYDLQVAFQEILSADKSLRQKVTFCPPVKPSELVNFYNVADVFINLTLHHDENFGFSQVEAMSCGLPVIGTQWGGLQDTIVHNETGFHVPTYVTSWGVRIDSPAALSSVLLLSRSKVLRKKMGRNARRRALTYYSIPIFEKNLVTEIRSMLKPVPQSKRVNRLSKFGREYYGQLGYRDDFGRNFKRKIYRRSNYHLYQKLIAPYASSAARNVRADDDFIFIPGAFHHGEGLVFNLIDLLWPISKKITPQEKLILSHVSRGPAVKYGELKRKYIDKLDVLKVTQDLIGKGLLAVSSLKGAQFISRG